MDVGGFIHSYNWKPRRRFGFRIGWAQGPAVMSSECSLSCIFQLSFNSAKEQKKKAALEGPGPHSPHLATLIGAEERDDCSFSLLLYINWGEGEFCLAKLGSHTLDSGRHEKIKSHDWQSDQDQMKWELGAHRKKYWEGKTHTRKDFWKIMPPILYTPHHLWCHLVVPSIKGWRIWGAPWWPSC